MEFYRYSWVQYAEHDGELCDPKFPNPSVTLNTYGLISETNKGYWIGWYGIKHKWISKTSKRKYAYLTKEEAMIHFKKRTERRIKILDWQSSCCKIALDLVRDRTI